MFQQLLLVGNVGKDAEIRYTPDGTPVTTFSVAVNRKWTNQDGSPGEEVAWFRVTTWRKLAELCSQYLRKGRQVLVIGRVSASAWMAQDGQARASLEVTASEVRFLGGREGGAAQTEPVGPIFDDDEDTDVPF